ncbi:MAG: LysR substrate-binding domain-containing protein, partial [Colwellia sp.]
ITCHACFQWLLPVTEQFSIRQPNIKIEFIEQDFANQHNQKKSTPVDLLFTDEKIENDGFTYHALGSFEVVAVLAKQKLTSEKWENKTFLSADDFSQHVLLTYPIKFEELDIFKLFLNNNKQNKSLKNKSVQSEKLKKKVPLLKPSLIKPKVIKQVANSHMILQMVAANMGITTLPDWLVSSLTKQSLVQTKRIGETGIYKTLYARYQADSTLADVIKQLIPHTVIAFEHLYNNQ